MKKTLFFLLTIWGESNFFFWEFSPTRASFVGVVYGGVTIQTGNLIIPMISHTFSNVLAALIWKKQLQKQN